MSSSSQGAGPKVGLVEQAYETFASGLSRRGFWLPPVFTGTGATSAVGVPLQPEMDNDFVVLLVARSSRCSRLPSSVDSILLGAASTTAFGEVRPLPRFGRVTRERRVLTRTVHLQPVFYALLARGPACTVHSAPGSTAFTRCVVRFSRTSSRATRPSGYNFARSPRNPLAARPRGGRPWPTTCIDADGHNPSYP